MNKRMIALIGLCAFLTACNSAPTADSLLAESADAMAAVDTVQFTLDREGPPIMLIPEQSVQALSAEGAYQAPGSVHAMLKVQMGSLVGEADVVWTMDSAVFKLPPLIPSYTPLDIGDTFDPVMIFDAEAGIPYILINALTNATLVGEEDVDGIATYHITAGADGEAIANLIGGAVSAGATTVDVWLDKETKQIVRLTITEEDGSQWIVDLFGYGEPVEIPTP